MSKAGSYDLKTFATSSEGEIRRLNAQLDLFWEKEFALYCRMGLKDGMKIMDCGSGPGYLTEKLLGLLPQSTVTAVEMDSSLVKVARQRLQEEIEKKRCTVVENSILELDFPDESFDFVVTRLVVEHVPDTAAACRELYRVLKPGGIVVVVDNDFEMHVKTFPPVSELNDLYDAYCRARFDAGGNPRIGRELPVLLINSGYDDVDLEIICAHSAILGDGAFLRSEGPGIPTQLVKDGYFKAETYQRLTSKWHDMLKTKGHAIVRQLYVATGKKLSNDERLERQRRTKTAVDNHENSTLEGSKKLVEREKENRSWIGNLSEIESMCDLVTEHVGKLLGTDDIDSIGEEVALTDLGIDSEMAVDLQISLNTAFDNELSFPATLVFDYPSIRAIAQFILEMKNRNSIGEFEKDASSQMGAQQGEGSHSDIDSLSDAEIEKKLRDKLNSLDED